MLSEISHDLDEIYYGTTNHLHPFFLQEEAEINLLESSFDRDEKRSQKAMEKIKRLMGSYHRIYGSSRSKTARMTDPDMRAIAQSKGNLAKIGNGGSLKSINTIIDLFQRKWSTLENLSKKTRDERKTLNNMKKSKKDIENLERILNQMKKFQQYYERAYETKSILINQEYECGALILIMGALNIMLNTNYLLSEFQSLNAGVEPAFHPADYARARVDDESIAWSKASKSGQGYSNLAERNFVRRILNDFAKELTKPSHENYLKGMNSAKINKATELEPSATDMAKAKIDEADTKKEVKEMAVKESTYITESEIGQVLQIVNSIRDGIYNIVRGGISTLKVVWNSVFGIIPLIRSIIFLNHKKRINAILALEENVEYLQANIDSLKVNKTFTDVEKQKIIAAQKKKLEGYKKKIAKMKAEFDIMEDDAEKMTKESNNNIGKDSGGNGSSSGDDLVLD